MPASGCDAAEVVDLLATGAEPGLMAIGSGRFFGWVIGGTLPAALAADWLVSAWDQNAGLRYATPAAAAIEEVAGAWLLDLLGLPASASVGFVTGRHHGELYRPGSARDSVLAGAGWDVHLNGLTGGPKVHVLVGEERHVTVDLALRYLGLGPAHGRAGGRPGPHPPRRLAEALAQVPAGDRWWCACRLATCTRARTTPSKGPLPWSTNGAGGCTLMAPSVCGQPPHPLCSRLVAGLAGADSWATDAHKTLNVPYDCGIAIVASPVAMRSAFSVQADYLIADQDGPGDPADRVA